MSRVLVVDDKAENAYYLEALLRGHGHEVETARHGAEALVLARQHPPDLVVSDLLMPVMDGYTLLRHWRSDPHLAAIPFVVYTATYTEPEDERLALDLGADDFILKPAEPEVFVERLRAVEAAARRGGPVHQPAPPDTDPDLLKLYSQTLVRKLEEKTLQLEQANRILEQEIAERRRAQHALELERSRLAEAQMVAHIGSWEVDLATMTMRWSEEMHRIFGTDPRSFRPTFEGFLESHHAAERGDIERQFHESLSRDEEAMADHRVVLADGRIKHVQHRWRVVRDGTGRPIRATGTCQDVTASAEAEATVRESETRFRQLAETISEVFWISNATKDRMLYVSPAYARIWGRDPAGLLADPRSWMESIHPDDRPAVIEALPRQATGDFDLIYRVVRPDGSIRWIRDRAFPVHQPDGSIERIVGIAEDITDRKAMEAQFLRAQRMESVGTLAGGIAHDLNNVLTPILISIDFLREATDPDERAEILATIESSARKGADMVRQVLSFARGVEGRRDAVDLGQLIRDIVRITNDTFLKSIQVISRLPRTLPAVVGDPTQLHQVLLNLCVNARDAMPDGGQITIAAAQRRLTDTEALADTGLPPGEYAVISVTDTGTGIPAKVIDRIFEPFFTTKDLGKGTGLGLSTSLAIVRSHGGHIGVRSVAGEGTTFEVFLPVQQAATEPVRPARAELPPGGEGETILVVDDEVSIRELTRRVLEGHGYRVLLATDGVQALAAFESHHESIAAVLTDMMMPVMDGAALIRELRRLDPEVKVLAVSGVQSAPDQPHEGDPVVRYLPKPYTAQELLRELRRVIHPSA